MANNCQKFVIIFDNLLDNGATDALTKIYSSPTESLTNGKEYLGGKLYDGKYCNLCEIICIFISTQLGSLILNTKSLVHNRLNINYCI